MIFAIKADIPDAYAETFVFPAHKTMYGGRRIAAGDTVFLFARDGGLCARGEVVAAEAVPKLPGVARQTPRVNVTVRRTALATRLLGRRELKPFDQWRDGRPETELNFKFYRQATNKIVALSAEAASFLDACFSVR
jgi:hypothetical protein